MHRRRRSRAGATECTVYSEAIDCTQAASGVATHCVDELPLCTCVPSTTCARLCIDVGARRAAAGAQTGSWPASTHPHTPRTPPGGESGAAPPGLSQQRQHRGPQPPPLPPPAHMPRTGCGSAPAIPAVVVVTHAVITTPPARQRHEGSTTAHLLDERCHRFCLQLRLSSGLFSGMARAIIASQRSQRKLIKVGDVFDDGFIARVNAC
jgi:hypothetical protein